jgi:hypothetical protein
MVVAGAVWADSFQKLRAGNPAIRALGLVDEVARVFAVRLSN